MIVFELLLPSWWEVQVTVAAAAFVIVAYWFFTSGRAGGCDGIINDRNLLDRACGQADVIGDKDKTGQLKGYPEANSTYLIKVELLAARNLIGANMNGTSDPYAIIICGEEKRFSSMVPGSRNPMWGEEFNFSVNNLPVEIMIKIYDWQIIWKGEVLGSVTIPIKSEGQTDALWYTLDSSTGQVCLHITTTKHQVNLTRFSNANTRRASELTGPTVVHQKPGPLQTIFNLPLDEVTEHSYSCALERSFLYHGRIYISTKRICFHSNVFSKQMKVIIPLENIDEIKRSQHAVINPAVTIILRMGTGGHGVPPLGTPDGRVRYKFASFWNRNHALRALERAVKNYHSMLEAEQKEKEQSALRANSIREGKTVNIPKEIKKFQSFIKEEVVSSIYNDIFPCTAEQFFSLLLKDGSSFTNEYRTARKDTNLSMGKWYGSEEYDGEVREITLRTLCNSPMCPPDTAMTEYQHVVSSSDKKKLVFETVQQAHDVPFGSCFEVHCRWSLESITECSCLMDIKVGVHFKKWCLMQSKIRSGATNEYKKDVEQMLEVARTYIKSRILNGEDENNAFNIPKTEGN